MPRLEEEIKQDVVDQLAWDERVNAAEVNVVVRDSTVVLRGAVPSYWAKASAVEDAEVVPGVGMVDDQLSVRWPPVYTPSDAELQDDVDRALRWNPNIDASRITINVSQGLVSLEGAVDTYWKKVHAERVASDVAGVLAVENRLAVVPTREFTDEAIASDIVESLKRNVLVDSEGVDVRVSRGIVTLSGSVPNRAALNAARDAARFTAGVVDVRDNLAITV
jgi:osmotically-inducible protein OsmY